MIVCLCVCVAACSCIPSALLPQRRTRGGPEEDQREIRPEHTPFNHVCKAAHASPHLGSHCPLQSCTPQCSSCLWVPLSLVDGAPYSSSSHTAISETAGQLGSIWWGHRSHDDEPSNYLWTRNWLLFIYDFRNL